MRRHTLPNVTRLLAFALLLAGCTVTVTPTPAPPATAVLPASATPAPTMAPASPMPPTREPATPNAAVAGWTGSVLKNCSMAQFEDYFRRDDGEKYGIRGATPDLEAQVEAARCAAGAVIRVWGGLEAETMDAYGRCIVAERLEIVSAPPTPAPELGAGTEEVDGWLGRIVPLCSHDRLDNYFEREDGVRFGIDAPLPPGGAIETGSLLETLHIAECEGRPIRIWGTLHKGVDDYRRTQIVVERAEKE